jgi:hypothetical protein
MGINEKSRNLYRPSRLTRDLSDKGRAVSRCPAHLQPTAGNPEVVRARCHEI